MTISEDFLHKNAPCQQKAWLAESVCNLQAHFMQPRVRNRQPVLGGTTVKMQIVEGEENTNWNSCSIEEIYPQSTASETKLHASIYQLREVWHISGLRADTVTDRLTLNGRPAEVEGEREISLAISLVIKQQ